MTDFAWLGSKWNPDRLGDGNAASGSGPRTRRGFPIGLMTKHRCIGPDQPCRGFRVDDIHRLFNLGKQPVWQLRSNLIARTHGVSDMHGGPEMFKPGVHARKWTRFGHDPIVSNAGDLGSINLHQPAARTPVCFFPIRPSNPRM